MAKRNDPTGAEVQQMQHVEKELARFLTRYQDNTEVAIIVCAMIRVARKLLDKYPPGMRAQLTSGSVAYLQRATPDLEADAGGLPPGFYIPKGIM